MTATFHQSYHVSVQRGPTLESLKLSLTNVFKLWFAFQHSKLMFVFF